MGIPALRRRLIFLLLAAGLFVGLTLLGNANVPYLSVFAGTAAVAEIILLLAWGFLRLFRRFLWRVGRRLAFSYFLIGALPVPLVALLLAVALLFLAGFFMGHVYRGAVHEIYGELVGAASARPTGTAGASSLKDVAIAVYRDGRRVSGDPALPAKWPAWLPPQDTAGPIDPQFAPPFVRLPDGRVSLAAAVGNAQQGAVALYTGDLALALAQRAGLWVKFESLDPTQEKGGTKLTIGTRTYELKPLREGDDLPGADAYFGWKKGMSVWQRPFLTWGDLSGQLLTFTDGSPADKRFLAALRASPAAVKKLLVSSNAEVNTAAWAALIAVAFLLFDIYAVALAMAFYMIFGLSRAVNRLSRGTAAVARGDFSARIPVKRKDQLGDLQRTFNQMAEHLEQLVQTAAQKEAIEKELAIARDLQKSLLPSEMDATSRPEHVEFATHFEPSAAIGGDYFDILRLGPDRLAVVIADVSGHGLPAGLRMAMLKAGLQILAEEDLGPQEILRRLDGLVRSGDSGRLFVTATLAILDFRSGQLELTNAGHPPAYLVRAEGVEEILLPGSPLGGLGHSYGQRRLTLRPGEALVLLSDGLIEATNPAGEPFGYDSVQRVLRGPAPSADAVRTRLLAAVAAHCAGQPAEDDRTLVVMRYAPPARG